MRVNENTAVSTSKILLVPYDAHHVERYHEWMQNESLREATASDLLSLDEEYENQQSWRTAHDKLTFIVCQRQNVCPKNADIDDVIRAGEDDAPPSCMVGDVNLFLTPLDDDDEDGDGDGDRNGCMNGGTKAEKGETRYVKGEIDIMIAAPEHRQKGLGEAVVRAFLRYLTENHGDVMREYVRAAAAGIESAAKIKRLVAKIHAENAGSIRLFGNLGFRRDGDPDYFNEISMMLDFPPSSPTAEIGDEGTESGGLGYRECFYDRSRLGGEMR
ncbi:acetyltransferase domain-containing protein [Xylaria castorea]|nr:acetyltransferase domain-containing protein [Xylaria castorea]